MVIKERQRSQELDKRPNIGIGLIIINPQGQIWTNVESMTKKGTERNARDISIPTEQVKEGEGLLENVKGGLGEFCSNKDIQSLRGNLSVVGLPKIVGVNSDNWQFACSLVTIMCDTNINPTPATNEVSPHGWMNIEEALGLPNLRSFSRQLLEIAKRDNLIEKALTKRDERFPILRGFGNGIYFDRFIQERDSLPDRFTINTDKISSRQETLSLFPRRVLLGEPHGLCAGVVRSIDAYREMIRILRAENPQAKIHSLGEPAHNTVVNGELRQQGVIFINNPEEAPKGATILLGAHGTAPNVRKAAENLGHRLIDTVCPLVTKTHTEAVRFQKEGYTIIYFGKKRHQEAEALLGESQREGNIILVENLEDLRGIGNKVKDPQRVAFLSQTTHPVYAAEKIKSALLEKYPNLRYPSHTDICYATQNRQDAVWDMVRKGAQAVVVLGSPTSSNSEELRNVAIKAGAKGIFIDSADELKVGQFAGVEIVGLTSGASVPEETFREMVQWFGINGSTEFVPVSTVDESKIHFAPVKMES